MALAFGFVHSKGIDSALNCGNEGKGLGRAGACVAASSVLFLQGPIGDVVQGITSKLQSRSQQGNVGVQAFASAKVQLGMGSWSPSSQSRLNPARSISQHRQRWVGRTHRFPPQIPWIIPVEDGARSAPTRRDFEAKGSTMPLSPPSCCLSPSHPKPHQNDPNQNMEQQATALRDWQRRAPN